MKTLLLTIVLLTVPNMAHAIWENHWDGNPRNSYEQQRHTYQKHGYDTERHGPLPDAIREEQRRQERQREEDRQRQENISRSKSTYGSQCRTLYGC